MGNILSCIRIRKRENCLHDQLDLIVDEYDQLYTLYESIKYDLIRSNEKISTILHMDNVQYYLAYQRRDSHMYDESERRCITDYHNYLVHKYSTHGVCNPFVDDSY